LENVVHGSIATTGNDRVEALTYSHAYLGGCVGSGASWLRFNLYASRPEHCRRTLHVVDPVFAPSS